jgi:6-phosphogluconolactonase
LRSHIERFAIVAPSAVRGRLGRFDGPEVFAFRREDPDTTRACRVQISGGVDFHPVRQSILAFRSGIIKHLAVGNCAIGLNVIAHPDFSLLIGVGHIQDLFVRGERDAIRPREITNNNLQFTAGITVHAVECQLLLGVLILTDQAVWRIREIKRSVRFVYKIVWAVQAFTLVTIDVCRDLTIVAYTDNAPIAVLAQQHGSVAVRDHAIRADERSGRRIVTVIPARAQNLCDALGRPLTDDVSDDIAKPEMTGRKPQRTFCELKTVREFLDCGRLRHERVHGRIGSEHRTKRGLCLLLGFRFSVGGAASQRDQSGGGECEFSHTGAVRKSIQQQWSESSSLDASHAIQSSHLQAMITRRDAFRILPVAAIAGHTAMGQTAKKGALVYVGTYTRGGSKGVYAYRFDSGTGKLTEAGVAAETPNPSFLTIHPNGRFLYAVNELSTFKDQKGGSVTAFQIDKAAGTLKTLNDGATGGTAPCHLVVDKTGRNLLVVNYGTGSSAVFRLQPDGSIGERSAFVEHSGSSANERRQKGPHAHSVNLSKSQRYAIVADLGTDEYIIYRFDPSRGSIERHGAAKVKPGSGPRHFSFDPKFNFGYGLNEMGSTVSVFQWNENAGSLTDVQTITTLPEGFSGTNNCAEVQIHPSGKYLYASNLGHDSLAMFAINQGKLSPMGNVSTGGKTPRNFRMDPSGNWLLAANQDTGNVVVFRIDKSTGKLTATGDEVKVPFPVCVKFL